VALAELRSWKSSLGQDPEIEPNSPHSLPSKTEIIRFRCKETDSTNARQNAWLQAVLSGGILGTATAALRGTEGLGPERPGASLAVSRVKP
jgi:hypothetical protein